jgi:glutaconate CoA-transferase subunit A
MNRTTNRMDKRTDLDLAIESVVRAGLRLALGGVTLYRRPMAFALGWIAHARRAGGAGGLTLINFTAGLESDLLVGEGLVQTMRTCYFGLEAFGLAPHFSQSAAHGELTILEETEASLASGLRATMAGVGFMPSIGWLGTDLPALRPDVRTVIDPYSGEELIAFPAIDIDVAVIHALRADPDGNAVIGGNPGVDEELALVADHVIVTTEEIVPELEQADLVAPAVDAVVLAEGGAWPTSCHPLYPLDGEAVLEYIEAVGTPAYANLLSSWADRHGQDYPR